MALFHCVCVFLMPESYSIVCMDHTSYVCSPITGYFGCFLVLTIVNRIVVKVGVLVSFWVKVFFGYMPNSGIAGSFGSSVFVGFSLLFFVEAMPISILSNSIRGHHFLHALSSIYSLKTFWGWLFWVVWDDYLSVIWFAFLLIIGEVKHLFVCFCFSLNSVGFTSWNRVLENLPFFKLFFDDLHQGIYSPGGLE